MSGLREGCKEPYSQQAGCIISLALRLTGSAQKPSMQGYKFRALQICAVCSPTPIDQRTETEAGVSL